MTSVAQNFLGIQAAIYKVKKPSSTVTIVGITKFQSIEKIREAITSGLTHLGINYVQDGKKLLEEFKNENIQWHFTGHIQSRKVKYLLFYELVQSIDRIEILKDLNERAKDRNKKISFLVELNIGNEPGKSGIRIEQLTSFLKEATQFSWVTIRGLMCMPPPLNPIEKRRSSFKKMYELYLHFQAEYGFDTLSMGTSDDYLLAVEEGSNMVRLGTCLFGPRMANIRN